MKAHHLPLVLDVILQPRNLVHDTRLHIQMADRISIDLPSSISISSSFLCVLA